MKTLGRIFISSVSVMSKYVSSNCLAKEKISTFCQSKVDISLFLIVQHFFVAENYSEYILNCVIEKNGILTAR